MASVSSGIRFNGIDRKSANPLRSAMIHDSTSMTATRRKNLAFRCLFVHVWTSCGGHWLGVYLVDQHKHWESPSDLIQAGSLTLKVTFSPQPKKLTYIYVQTLKNFCRDSLAQ